MSELEAAQTHIVDALTDEDLAELLGVPADGHEAAVYSALAPQGAAYPCAVMQMIPGSADWVTQGGNVNMGSPMVYAVKVIGEGEGEGDISDAYAMVHNLLQAASSQQDEFLVNSFRISPANFPASFEAGKHYRQIGGFYRLIVRNVGEA